MKELYTKDIFINTPKKIIIIRDVMETIVEVIEKKK